MLRSHPRPGLSPLPPGFPSLAPHHPTEAEESVMSEVNRLYSGFEVTTLWAAPSFLKHFHLWIPGDSWWASFSGCLRHSLWAPWKLMCTLGAAGKRHLCPESTLSPLVGTSLLGFL